MKVISNHIKRLSQFFI